MGKGWGEGQRETCRVRCLMRKSKRARLAAATSSSICSLDKPLKSAARGGLAKQTIELNGLRMAPTEASLLGLALVRGRGQSTLLNIATVCYKLVCTVITLVRDAKCRIPSAPWFVGAVRISLFATSVLLLHLLHRCASLSRAPCSIARPPPRYSTIAGCRCRSNPVQQPWARRR